MEEIPPKFHPDPVQKDGDLDFFWRGRSNKKKNKMRSEMRSVPDLITEITGAR